MLKKAALVLGLIFLYILIVAGYFWTYRHNETLRYLINSQLTTLATKSDQADPELVWLGIQNHLNPTGAIDNFVGSEFTTSWKMINLNGKGIVTSPPVVHAANASLENGKLILSVLHDPDFDDESGEAISSAPAAQRYNNAYAIGFQDYSPTPSETILIETKMTVSPNFHGTTGLWIEEKGTFDESGVMVKPFRAFGISFVGLGSNTFLQGLQLEAVVGFVPVCAKDVNEGVDVTQENLYTLSWSIVNEKEMRVDLFVNKLHTDSCIFPSFYPGEIQLWADNFKVDDLSISHLNLPEGTEDKTTFDYVSVEVISK